MEELYLGEEGKLKLLSGISKLSKAVLSTMGPDGRTVIIQDENLRSYVTKDGVSVANAIKFKDPVENIGAQLIKEVAQKTADEAGDGTTTSICLATAFIKYGIEYMEKYKISVNELNRRIDLLVEKLLKQLEKDKKELKREDIHKVATISANGDDNIGQLVQGAYNFSDVIRVEEGKLKEDEVELISGMIYETSYFSSKFVNDSKKNAVNYDNCSVLVLDKKLEDLKPYQNIFTSCANTGTPLIVFTEFVTESVLKLLEANVINETIKLAVVKSPGFGNYRKLHLEDIAAFTGGVVVTNDKATHIKCGTAKNVTITKTKTIISNDLDMEDRINDLKIQASNEEVEYDEEFLNERIDNLNGSLAVIKVGGSSEVEMKERKDRIDDAVLAVKSALEEGIVEGGGNALPKAAMKLDFSDEETLLVQLVCEPALHIQKNSGGKIQFDINKDYFKQNIIDPFKVTRCSLQNAASVAKTILSTEAVVLNEYLWK